MNSNKITAVLIFAFLFFVPFRILFLGDEIISGGKFIFYFMTCLAGFLIAFGIGTNEPFGKNKRLKKAEKNEETAQHRKAA